MKSLKSMYIFVKQRVLDSTHRIVGHVVRLDPLRGPRNSDGVLSRAEYAKRIELPDGQTQAERPTVPSHRKSCDSSLGCRK